MKIKISESKLRNIITESIRRVINETIENTTPNNEQTYAVYGVESGGSYWDIYFCYDFKSRNDKEALKYFLSQEYTKYQQQDMLHEQKGRKYVIGTLDEEGYLDNRIYKIEFYIKGKKVHYRYTYTPNGEYTNVEFFDSFEKQNKKKFYAYVLDSDFYLYPKEKFQIPSGYCGSLSMLKKYLLNYMTKNNLEDMSISIFDFKKEKMVYYWVYKWEWDNEVRMREYDPLNPYGDTNTDTYTLSDRTKKLRDDISNNEENN